MKLYQINNYNIWLFVTQNVFSIKYIKIHLFIYKIKISLIMNFFKKVKFIKNNY